MSRDEKTPAGRIASELLELDRQIKEDTKRLNVLKGQLKGIGAWRYELDGGVVEVTAETTAAPNGQVKTKMNPEKMTEELELLLFKSGVFTTEPVMVGGSASMCRVTHKKEEKEGK